MDLKDLRRLVRLVEGSEINELEIEDGESRVRIVKSFAGSQPVSHTIVSQAAGSVHRGVSVSASRSGQ